MPKFIRHLVLAFLIPAFSLTQAFAGTQMRDVSHQTNRVPKTTLFCVEALSPSGSGARFLKPLIILPALFVLAAASLLAQDSTHPITFDQSPQRERLDEGGAAELHEDFIHKEIQAYDESVSEYAKVGIILRLASSNDNQVVDFLVRVSLPKSDNLYDRTFQDEALKALAQIHTSYAIQGLYQLFISGEESIGIRTGELLLASDQPDSSKALIGALAHPLAGVRARAEEYLSQKLKPASLLEFVIGHLKPQSFAPNDPYVPLNLAVRWLPLLQKAVELKIREPFRLSLDNLETILQNRLHNVADGRPLAIVLQGLYDHDDNTLTMADEDIVTPLLTHGYRLLYFQTDGTEELTQSLLEGAKSEPASLQIFSGHGDRTRIVLSPKSAENRKKNPELDFIKFKWRTKMERQQIAATLKPGGQIILDACSNGQGGESRNNLANYLRSVFPQTKREGIWASKEVFRNIRLHFNDRNDFERATYERGPYRYKVYRSSVEPPPNPYESVSLNQDWRDAQGNNIGLRISRLVQAIRQKRGLPFYDTTVKKWGVRSLALEIPILIVAASNAFVNNDSSWAAHFGQRIFSIAGVAGPTLVPTFLMGLAASMGLFLTAHLLLLVIEHLVRGDSPRYWYWWLGGVPKQMAIFALYVVLPLVFRTIGLHPDLAILLAGWIHLKFDQRVTEEIVFGLIPTKKRSGILTRHPLLRIAATLVLATHLLPLLPSAGVSENIPTSIAYEPAAKLGHGVHSEILARSARGPQLKDVRMEAYGRALQDFIHSVGIQVFYHQWVSLDYDRQQSVVKVLGQTSSREAVDTLVFMLRSYYDSPHNQWVEDALYNHPLRPLVAQDLGKLVKSSKGEPQWSAIRVLENTDWRLGLEAALIGYLTSTGPAGVETSKSIIHRGTLPTWPLWASADSKVYSYLQNWTPSANSVMTPHQRDQLLDLIWRAHRHGIEHPLRLSAEVLKEVLKNRDASRPDGRRLAVVIFPKSDYNTAFMDSNEISQMIWNGYRVMFYEAPTKLAVIDILASSAKQQSESLLELGGHGWQQGMQLGGQNSLPPIWPFSQYYLTTNDEADLLRIRNSLSTGGQVILKSCSTGKGGSNSDNLANMLRRVFPQAATIWSPTVDGNISRLEFNWQTHQLELVIYSETRLGYRASVKHQSLLLGSAA